MLGLFLFANRTYSVMTKIQTRKENCTMKITFELNEKEFEELKDLIFMTKKEDIYEKRMKIQPLYKEDDVIFDSQEDAYTALSSIRECASLYGFVSMADYKEIAGVKTRYKDKHFGWVESDLNEVHVYRVRGGYGIRLPYPKPIMR